ncbi:MAG TPA: TonB-dependent receptor, partial [Terriglobales bacterium]|nr:TonB-dependent receptor [Terriglobales bacterium]
MKRFSPVFVALLVALFVAAFSGSKCYAQNSRGSITGQVTDPTGAAIPFASVTVTDTETGAVQRVKTTQQGFYTAPGLLPDHYTVTVSARGFMLFKRTGIQLHTQETATINVRLSVGSASQVVTVTANAPLIDMADASTGQVLTTDQVQNLPSDGRAPLGFTHLEYGVVTKAKHALSGSSPVDNQNEDDFSLGGGNSSSNELLLNGVPNMQDGDRYGGFSPQLDSVNEVRVDEFGANAMYGDTSGGTVNMTTKSGTNAFHGSASWFYQSAGCSGLSGKKFLSRSANGCTWMAALPYAQPAGGAVPMATHQNQIGATIGGPVWIPHVFNGRNKLFFFYGYEAYVGQQPPTQTIGTVPTQAERNGDFSALLNLDNGQDYQLYNPNSASGTQNSYQRQPIPGNILANAGLAVSPIAKAYYKLVPLPNYQGPTTTQDGENNYFTYTPTVLDYRSHMGRLDYNIGANDKIFAYAYRSRQLNTSSNEFHDALSGTNTDQIFAGGQVDEVHTFSPTMFMETRGGLSRFDTSNGISSDGISPSSFGFPGYLAQDASALALPMISFKDQTDPDHYSTKLGNKETFDTLQLFSMLTKVWRSHTFIGGVDLRAYKQSVLSPGYADGSFSFANSDGNPVAKDNTSPPAYFGSSFALFDLGIPTGGEEDINPRLQYNSFLNAF